jgi:hypothetical protein
MAIFPSSPRSFKWPFPVTLPRIDFFSLVLMPFEPLTTESNRQGYPNLSLTLTNSPYHHSILSRASSSSKCYLSKRLPQSQIYLQFLFPFPNWFRGTRIRRLSITYTNWTLPWATYIKFTHSQTFSITPIRTSYPHNLHSLFQAICLLL